MSDDRVDGMAFTEYEAERNQEPPGDVVATIADLEAERLRRCSHPWIDTVCSHCGRVLEPSRMNPEER